MDEARLEAMEANFDRVGPEWARDDILGLIAEVRRLRELVIEKSSEITELRFDLQMIERAGVKIRRVGSSIAVELPR